MRSVFIIILTSIWLSGITIPPILQLIDDNAQLISFALNEEEQKEQGEKDLKEEVFISEHSEITDLNILNNQNVAFSLYRIQYLSLSAEIDLPPPEQGL